MMFYDTEDEIEYVEPRDYEHITELVRERGPRKIAIAQHDNEQMLEALGNKYASRSIDSWFIGVRRLEPMGPEQINFFR